MYGAILGDIVGSPYEFNNLKSKDFPLLSRKSTFTDDSLMTLAVAEAFLDAGLDAEEEVLQRCLIQTMPAFARRYPMCGFGAQFLAWLESENHVPYNSFGNGSAMRVSPVAWFYDDLPSVRRAARISAAVTHNHPEGIKGAEAVASAIFLARTGSGKDVIRSYAENEFGYDLNRTCAQIRAIIQFDETCPGSVPEAITAFIEGNSFVDVLRTAVSIGGDSDTIACIAGAIAEGFYGISPWLKIRCQLCLPRDLRAILARTRRFCYPRRQH